MKTLSVRPTGTVRSSVTRGSMVRSALLVCGVLAAVLYAAMNAFVPLLYPGYSYVSHTVSELSAIGAPTRQLWAALGFAYPPLIAAFAWGVWAYAGRNRPLRVVGVLLLVHSLIALLWPPMHQRGVAVTLTDTLHVGFGMANVVVMVLAIGFSAAALGTRFRAFAVTTLVVLLVTGAMTGADAPNVAANLPTPWVGAWERGNIAAYLLWVVVFAIALLRAPVEQSRAAAGPAYQPVTES